MSLKIRPIRYSDVAALIANPDIAHITDANIDSKAPGTVTSDLIFKSYHEDKNIEYVDEFTKMGHIDLRYPIINPLLAGNYYSAWRIAAGLDSTVIADIVNYRVVRNVETGELESVSEVGDEIFDIEKYQFGANILKSIIQARDIKEASERAIHRTYAAKVAKALGIKKEDIPVGSIYDADFEEIEQLYLDNPEYAHKALIGRTYVVDLSFLSGEDGSIDIDMYNYENSLEDIFVEDSAEKPSQFDELDLLSSMARDKDGIKTLFSQVMTVMFVLPIGYRPTIGGREDKLTEAYASLAKANIEVEDVLLRPTATIRDVAFRLNNLYQHILHVMLNNGQFKSDDPSYKCLVDSLKGKDGLIRDRMEAARIDYSARTVITCDPFMPIDEVGVPIDILKVVAQPALAEYFKSKGTPGEFTYENLTYLCEDTQADFGIDYIELLKEMFNEKSIYGIIGRQPTLFYLGMQGFKIRPVEGKSIVLSPLIVMPFNADFDGDQMHFTLPTTAGGIKDVKDKMLFVNNMWYPKNGECTVVIRHEILYGVWIAMRGEHFEELGFTAKSTNLTLRQAYDSVANGYICNYNKGGQQSESYNQVYDKVGDDYVGRMAVEYVIFGDKGGKLPGKIKPSSMTKLLIQNSSSTQEFLNKVNMIVRLGFKVAEMYPPTLTILLDNRKFIRTELDKMVDEFNHKVLKYYNYIKIGVELESNYDLFYSSEWDKLNSRVEQFIKEQIPIYNGYKLMADSGAKGDLSNLVQLFGIKGRIQKNAVESFNTIISGNYTTGLNGLEHYMTGYGSREGLIEKVLNTSEPGYLSRKLEHAGPTLKISVEDCGTTEGLEFYPSDIIKILPTEDRSNMGMRPIPYTNNNERDTQDFYKDESVKAQWSNAISYMKGMLLGRFVVTDEGTTIPILNDADAGNYIRMQWGNTSEYEEGTRIYPSPVRLRSPLKCRCPVCQTCYGVDKTKGTVGMSVDLESLVKNSYIPKDYLAENAEELDKQYLNDVIDIIMKRSVYIGDKLINIKTVAQAEAAVKYWLQHFNYQLGYGLLEVPEKYGVSTIAKCPDLGQRVGFIAAQAIGEPGTQLTMKNFQKGGVAGKKNMTSNFKIIESLFDMVDFANHGVSNGITTYNKVSSATGFVKAISIGGGNKRIIVTEKQDSNTNLLRDNNLIVKSYMHTMPYVHKGDPLFREGNISIQETARYGGHDLAVKTLLLTAYNLFLKSDVSLIHFEIIATAMTAGTALHDCATNSNIKKGDIITLEESMMYNVSIIPFLVGIKSLPKYKQDFFESLAMESMTTYIPRAIVKSKEDSMNNPIIRTMFGLHMSKGRK